MKVKNIFTVTVPVLMLTVLLGSCIRENIIYVDDVTSRTVFVYMAADNNLNGYVDDNINQMKMSVSKMPYKANLIVYVDRLKAKPMLLNVKFEKIDTIKVFPELNSSSADTFEMIFREVKHRWPADKYGLLMWSHGTGWIPKSQLHNVAWNLGYAPARDGRQALSPIYERIPDIRDPFAPTKTFGFEKDANGNYLCIELDELAAVIPDKEFEFIIFDACYMGCVEVAYALRNKTEYFVSSSVEILGQGFPYYETTPFMMEGDMNNVCKKFFEHYDRKSGWERTGGISLVKTAELDKLASSFNKIVAQWPTVLI